MASDTESGMDVILQRRLRAYELALDTARRDAVAAAQTLSKLTARIGELELELSEARERPGRLEGQLSETKRARRSAEQRAYAERVHREELQQQLAELETGRAQAAETAEELAAAEARHAELEEEVAILRRRADEADHLAAASHSARERAEQRVAELSSELEALRNTDLATSIAESVRAELELAEQPPGPRAGSAASAVPDAAFADSLNLERELIASERSAGADLEPDGQSAHRLALVLRALRPELSTLASVLERERAARLAADARVADLEQRLEHHLERANRAFAMIEQLRGSFPHQLAGLAPDALDPIPAPFEPAPAAEPSPPPARQAPRIEIPPNLRPAARRLPPPVPAAEPAQEAGGEVSEPAGGPINPERLAEALKRLRAVTGAALEGALDDDLLTGRITPAPAPEPSAEPAATEPAAAPGLDAPEPAVPEPGAPELPSLAFDPAGASGDDVDALLAMESRARVEGSQVLPPPPARLVAEHDAAPEPASPGIAEPGAEPEDAERVEASTLVRPWLRASFGRLARYDPDAAGRLVLALLPLQEMAYPKSISYDIGSGAHWVHVTVRPNGQQIEITEQPRPQGDVDFSVEADPVTLSDLMSAGRIRRRLGFGLPKVRGDRARLVALDALLDVPLFASELDAAGVELAPVMSMKLVAAMIGRDPTNGKQFTLGYRGPEAEETAAAEVALMINAAQRPEVILDAPSVTTMIVCEPGHLLGALMDLTGSSFRRIGARDPLNWVQRRVKTAQSV